MAGSDKPVTLVQLVTIVAIFAIVGTVSIIGCGGCGDGSDGEGYEDIMQNRKTAVDALIEKGGKAEEKRYPQGDAWSINLSGLTIDDDVLLHIEEAQRVTELNFSGSTVSDAHAARINGDGIGSFLLKLDLSKTEFSDAGLEQLTKLPLLRELNLAGSKVTSAGIAKWQQARMDNPNINAMFERVTVKK